MPGRNSAGAGSHSRRRHRGLERTAGGTPGRDAAVEHGLALLGGVEQFVRPGEQIPADGEVVAGRATVDQAAITGEPLPADVGPGSRVYAATIAQFGGLRVRVERAGADSTFGRVVRLVAEAEAQRGPVQTAADRFSGIYLPVVVGIAALTLLLRRDPLATAAVLVVACSCSFALATPIAMLASICAAARRGLLIKGGRVLETLARAEGQTRPRAYLDWFTALEQEGRYREALAAAQEALQALPPRLPIRAEIACAVSINGPLNSSIRSGVMRCAGPAIVTAAIT